MPHSTNVPYLNKKNIDKYLNELSLEILRRGVGTTEILVVGGSAIALNHRFGRATVDIDICVQQQNRLYECIIAVAEKEQINEDWMNADVMHSLSFSYQLFNGAMPYRTFNNVLSVYTVNDLDLVCMKLKAMRPKDGTDILKLAPILKNNRITKEDIMIRIEQLYCTRFLEARAIKMLNTTFR